MAKLYKNPRFIEQELEDDEIITKHDEEVALNAEKPKNDEDASFKKRYSDLRRHSQKKEAEFQEQIDALKVQLAEASQKSMKLPKTEDEVKEWMTKYPDLAGIIETMIQKRTSETETRLEQLRKEHSEAKSATEFERAKANLIKAHPDFEDIAADSAFHEWVQTQEDAGRTWIKNALFHNTSDWQLAADAIQYYKDSKKDKKKTEPDKKRKDAAEVVTRPQASREISSDDYDFSESQIQAMKAHEYDAKEEEIMDAMRKGRVLMDITGAAR